MKAQRWAPSSPLPENINGHSMKQQHKKKDGNIQPRKRLVTQRFSFGQKKTIISISVKILDVWETIVFPDSKSSKLFFSRTFRQPDGKNLGAQEINQTNCKSFRIQRRARFSNGEKEMSFLEDSFWRLRFLKSFEIRILQTNCTKKAIFWSFSTFFSAEPFASPLVKTWEPKKSTKQTASPLESNDEPVFRTEKKKCHF